VIVADGGYAVIDGVTDRNGTRYCGMLSGQFAARVVKRATEQFILSLDPVAPRPATYDGPSSFIDHLTGALHQAYRDLGVLERVEEEAQFRACCTVVAALQVEGRIEIVAVGDSGIRINNSDVIQVLKPLDDVTGILRRESWRYFASAGLDAEECDRRAAALTWRGTRNQEPGTPTADAAFLETIEQQALAACRSQLPEMPEGEIEVLIREGIINGQGRFQNRANLAFGYGTLDGFPVPEEHICSRSYDLSVISSVELFTDGYFKLGEDFGIASWEAAFREVEAADPHKIGPYLSTKGTTRAAYADDRTYVGVLLG
jgi:hypothetical protein